MTKTYTDRMEQFEFVRYDIEEIFFDNNHQVEKVTATFKVKYVNVPHSVELSRRELIELIEKGENGFYYLGKKITDVSKLEVLD